MNPVDEVRKTTWKTIIEPIAKAYLAKEFAITDLMDFVDSPRHRILQTLKPEQYEDGYPGDRLMAKVADGYNRMIAKNKKKKVAGRGK